MHKRIVVILTFVIVFGLPITWYLFLQVFGENKFDLPVLAEWPDSCQANLPEGKGAVFYHKNVVLTRPNEWKRIIGKLEDVSGYIILEKAEPGCLRSFDLLLVDKDGKVRGEYEITREETDRLFTEIDIYVMNLQDEK